MIYLSRHNLPLSIYLLIVIWVDLNSRAKEAIVKNTIYYLPLGKINLFLLILKSGLLSYFFTIYLLFKKVPFLI